MISGLQLVADQGSVFPPLGQPAPHLLACPGMDAQGIVRDADHELTSFLLLLSVMPMLAAAAGASSSAAGLITGSLLLGTVAAEAVAAAAIRRFGYRMVLAAGAVLLGAPALAMLAREPQAVMMSVGVVRGLGFGLCGVATRSRTAKL